MGIGFHLSMGGVAENFNLPDYLEQVSSQNYYSTMYFFILICNNTSICVFVYLMHFSPTGSKLHEVRAISVCSLLCIQLLLAALYIESFQQILV